ncbi:anaphase-promoting complex, cyclosome, subunit 4-domain-containing protein [Hypoxylon sp. NC1633]|nr:anaphase-promoting complex, cyclosome, subunit 4-domain-containing protein [Hypoxylon sp. NC1633]
MVVLAASICTRGGKAVLSRQFREMPRSRIEALLASFPKLADSGTQHTTVEQDNVRFVYQPLDELYMVLITNRQSNILQDIDSLHLFAQVVTSTCRTLDEREILKNAYELLSAFDELVSLGYRENLTISQIKTFLEMESHEERIQEIIARNKELEATEERKRKAKQLELQRKESARSGRPGAPRTPVYPTYTPPTRPAPADTYDTYEAEKNKSHKPAIMKGKGMQLGKKSKTTDMFERVRGDMGAEVDDSPLVPAATTPVAEPAAPRMSSTLDRDAIHITINESISAKLSREGSVNSLAVSGDLSLKISDSSLTKVKLNLVANASHGAQFRTHPNVDRGLFTSSKAIQMSNVARGFPVNIGVGVLRWRATPKTDDTSALPISFTVWVNRGSGGSYTMTVEYELTGGDVLKDVSVTIPYATSEPSVSSFDATYEVSGDSLEWTIGTVSDDNASGSFEFDAQADDENEFFPMQVRFSKTTPFIDVDVTSVSLVEENEEVTFSKDIKSVADSYLLRLISESQLDPKPRDGLITYNPTIELFAGAAGSKTLQIWRSNGHVITQSSQRGERDSVKAVCWKYDGQFLAVGWSDGVIRLMGLETNKAVHQIRVCDAGKSQITCIGWAHNNAGTRSDSTSAPSTVPWEDLLSRELFPSGKKAAADLPRELTFLEVETALPKLSPLPVSGGSDDDSFVFTTRASLEFLFRPFAACDSHKVDVMIVGTNDGEIHLSIYDSFVIGKFKYSLPQPFARNNSLHLSHHASHPDLSTHMLVFKPSENDRAAVLYLVPMDLTFIHSSPENLSLLASKTTALQKLLRYIKQVEMHMMNEWQSTRELPTRFLNSINETLRESGNYGEMNIGQALYHSVVTGHTFPEVAEWLVDQLAERGHKRWDKAVVSGLRGLRSLVHENFLPALERIGIILSRLLGIARYHESKAEIGFTSAQILQIMDIVSCLMLVGNKILLFVMEELDLFQSFSIWLRHEIDRLASSSSAMDELTDKEATMDHAKILNYIQQYLAASPLRHHLSSVPTDHSKKGRQQTESGNSLLQLIVKQLQKQDDGQSDEGPFPQIEFLCGYLEVKAGAVFEGIAEAEKRSVRFGQPTAIELGSSISKFDVTMSAILHTDTYQGLTYAAVTTEQDESSVYVFRTTLNVLNGISGPFATEVSHMVLGDGKVLDLKFLNDDSLLVLIPHKSEELSYRPYSPGSKPEPHSLSNDQVASAFPILTVPSEPGESSFVPAQMEVREASSERGKIPARVCLLGNDSQTYKVFALPEDMPRNAIA